LVPDLLWEVLKYVPIGVAGGILGGVIAVVRQPEALSRSIVQHIAAGLLTAIIAVDLMPDVRVEGEPFPVLAGFAVGSILMIILKGISRWVDDIRDDGFPVGLVVVAGLDTFVDGLIVGVGFAADGALGILLTVALGVELFVLTMSVASELEKEKIPHKVSVIISVSISSMLLVGALLGAWLLSGLSPATQAIFLAFAAAALLYLVTDELLIKGHDNADRVRTTAAFFVGFLVLMAFILLGPA
jgi:zinc transporter, ZIP family